jgi:hypothetical protein
MPRRTRTWLALILLGIASNVPRPLGQPEGTAHLEFSTYFGGTGADAVTAVRVDGAGNIYVAGSTRSPDLSATTSLFGPPAGSGTFGFLMKLRPNRSIVYSTYLERPAVALAVDAAGNAIVADNLSAANKFSGQTGDVVVTKINSTGTEVIYSVRLAGSKFDFVESIALDLTGAVVLTGHSNSPDFPLVNALQSTVPSGSAQGAASAFITKLDADGRIVFSTGWGGIGEDAGAGVAIDRNLDIIVSGVTASPDFVTTPGAFQRTLASTSCTLGLVPCRDAFVTRLSGDGQVVRYSTLFGGTNGETVAALAVDQFGSAHIAGVTTSSDLPLRNARQAACDGHREVTGCSSYLTKFSPDGSSLHYSTYFGSQSYYVYGPGLVINDLAVESDGSLVAIGTTQGNDLPLARAFQTLNGGGPLFKSTDDGVTWTPSSAGMVGTGVWQIAGAGRQSPLYAGPLGGAVFHSADQAGTWRGRRPTIDTEPSSFVVDPLTPSTLYATGRNGALKSTDAGETWSRMPLEESTFLGLAIAPTAPSNVFVSVRRGVFQSRNGGTTWSLILDTDPDGNLSRPYVQTLAVDPQDADAVYAAFSDGYIVRREGGQRWTSLATLGCPANQLVFAGGPSSAMYARACGKVYKSVDRGGSWREVGFAERTAAWIDVDPSMPNALYVASAHNGVFRSGDHGETWTRIREPLEQDVRSILVDRSSRGTIYVGATASSNAFVTRFDPSGAVTLSSYLGGLNATGTSIATDRNGALIVGGTAAHGFPLMQPLQRSYHGAIDAFVARILDHGAF